MQHFTKRIEVNDSYYGFYFNRIYTVEGVRYHISVVDKERKAHSFNMMEKKGVWVLVKPETCPEWIAKLEPTLSGIIHENQEKKH